MYRLLIKKSALLNPSATLLVFALVVNDVWGGFNEDGFVDLLFNSGIGFPAGKHDDAVDVCALIGLALDETNPGYVPHPVNKTLPDRWERAFNEAEHDDFNWKMM